MHSLHPLELRLYPIPVAFYVLGVYPSYWINKVKGVVHRLMVGNLPKLLHAIVCCPLVTVHDCPTAKVLLQYRQQCLSTSIRDDRHHSQGWSVAGITHAEHPNIGSWRTSPVMLKGKNITVCSIRCQYHLYQLLAPWAYAERGTHQFARPHLALPA